MASRNRGARLSEDVLRDGLLRMGQQKGAKLEDPNFILTDVFIAGSGPIAWVLLYA